MKTYAEILYPEIIGVVLERFYNNGNDIKKNIETLTEVVEPININKCSVEDIEKGYPGTMHQLAYLLQSRRNINFGICEMYKTWMNNKGWQRGCRFDKGLNKRIQVNCFGRIESCERKEKMYDYIKRKKK